LVEILLAKIRWQYKNSQPLTKCPVTSLGWGGIFFFATSSNQLPFNKLHNKQQREKEKKIKIKKNQGQGGKLFILRRPKTGNENCSNATNEGKLSKGKTARKSGSCIGD